MLLAYTQPTDEDESAVCHFAVCFVLYVSLQFRSFATVRPVEDIVAAKGHPKSELIQTNW